MTTDINELLEEARGELKRADHLVYVSLKYTRTVDVIKSVIERLINAFDFASLVLLESAKKKGLIKEYPASIGLRIDLLTKLLSYEQEIIENVELFKLLRKINKADFLREEEYRRHVKMIATLDTGDVVEIKIDTVKEYYDRATQFIALVKSMVIDKKDD